MLDGTGEDDAREWFVQVVVVLLAGHLLAPLLAHQLVVRAPSAGQILGHLMMLMIMIILLLLLLLFLFLADVIAQTVDGLLGFRLFVVGGLLFWSQDYVAIDELVSRIVGCCLRVERVELVSRFVIVLIVYT